MAGSGRQVTEGSDVTKSFWYQCRVSDAAMAGLVLFPIYTSLCWIWQVVTGSGRQARKGSSCDRVRIILK